MISAQVTMGVLKKQFDISPMDVLINCTLADLYEEAGDEKHARIHRLIAQDEIHIIYDERRSTVKGECWDIFVRESVGLSHPARAWDVIDAAGWEGQASAFTDFGRYAARMLAHHGWRRFFDASPLLVVEKAACALKE